MDAERDHQQPQEDLMSLVVMPSTKSLVLLCGCFAEQTMTHRTTLVTRTKTFPRQTPAAGPGAGQGLDQLGFTLRQKQSSLNPPLDEPLADFPRVSSLH